MSIMNVSNKEMDCPFCKKAGISVTITPGYYSHRTARAAHKVRAIPVYHPEKIEVQSKCQNCGKSKSEIKEALEKGTATQLSHEERLKRLQEAGLPTKIENKRI